MICHDCKGDGEVEWPKHVRGGPIRSEPVAVKCPKCSGTGKVKEATGMSSASIINATPSVKLG